MRNTTAPDRNSFSRQLERVMVKAEIKNAALAEELNYDVSYISKWITGSALPSRKNIDRIISTVVNMASRQIPAQACRQMMMEIGVATESALWKHVGNSLRGAYMEASGQNDDKLYVHNAALWINPRRQAPLLAELAAGLNPDQPLRIAAMADLFCLDHRTRLALAGIRNQHFRIQQDRPDITLDYLVVCAFMAVSLAVIRAWIVPILIECAVVAFVTVCVCFYFGSRIGGDNDFERALGLYGTATGTVPTGVALLRIVDPAFQTNTAVELGLTNLVMMASTPVVIAMMLYAQGDISETITMIVLAGCCVLYLVLLKVCKVWGKKTFDWK